MNAVELTDFWRVEPDGEQLADLWFEFKKPEQSLAPYDLTIDGWAIGKSSPVQAVELGVDGRCLWSLPLSVPRDGREGTASRHPMGGAFGLRASRQRAEAASGVRPRGRRGAGERRKCGHRPG